MEPGTSGSGFLEATTGRLVGVDSGGGSYCGINNVDQLLAAANAPDTTIFPETFGRLARVRPVIFCLDTIYKEERSGGA